MTACKKCSEYGLNFNRAYSPAQYLEGQPSSRVWIIGLNPKGKTTYADKRNEENLRQYFSEKGRVHEYFRDFQKVSRTMYYMMGKDDGVGHTNLVKCYSPQWPPIAAKSGRDRQFIIENCKEYLKQQLLDSTVTVLVCNGADVCRYIQTIIPAKENHETYYYGELNRRRIAVVLSGFIGRIDDYSKRRLGKEIEALMAEFGICDKGG
jgi:hypothetical protein